MEYMPLVVLPSRMESIRVLHFTWKFPTTAPPLGARPESKFYFDKLNTQQAKRWAAIWHNLSTMCGLRSLHVRLDVRWHTWQSLNEPSARKLLDPIRAVTAPAEFVLYLPFPAIEQRTKGGVPLDFSMAAPGSEQERMLALMCPRQQEPYPWAVSDDWIGEDPWDALENCTIVRETWEHYGHLHSEAELVAYRRRRVDRAAYRCDGMK
jgi:hypothetical protein